MDFVEADFDDEENWGIPGDEEDYYGEEPEENESGSGNGSFNFPSSKTLPADPSVDTSNLGPGSFPLPTSSAESRKVLTRPLFPSDDEADDKDHENNRNTNRLMDDGDDDGHGDKDDGLLSALNSAEGDATKSWRQKKGAAAMAALAVSNARKKAKLAKASRGGGGDETTQPDYLVTRFSLRPRFRRDVSDPFTHGAFDRAPKVPSVQCTLLDGRRIFIPHNPQAATGDTDTAGARLPPPSPSKATAGGGGKAAAIGGLLSVPMASLFAEVDKERYRRMATAPIAAPSTATSKQQANKNENGVLDGNDGDEESDGGGGSGGGGGPRLDNNKNGEGAAASSSSSSDGGSSSWSNKKLLTAGTAGQHLWVDKYKPKNFSELLSAEQVNRGVLHALKSWDAFVFKTSPEVAQQHEAKALSAVAGSGGQSPLVVAAAAAVTAQAAAAAAGAAAATEVAKVSAAAAAAAGGGGGGGMENDRDKRPRIKVILLCGAAGMGKTTLAHVVAKHAGYSPIEVNASDDRTAGALREKVERSMESQAVSFAANQAEGGGKARPSLLILDEIDGADSKGAMEALLSIVKAPLRLSTPAAANPSSKGKKKSQQQPLTRPLICICNDLYAPHLRPLRDVSLVFHFKPTSEQSLLQRLKFICKHESRLHAQAAATATAAASALQKKRKSVADDEGCLAAEAESEDCLVDESSRRRRGVGALGDMNASSLTALCQATGNDLRSCINTLQFVSMRLAKEMASSSSPSSSLKNSPPPPTSSSVLLRTIESGIKDERRDVFEVWASVFSRQPANQRRQLLARRRQQQQHQKLSAASTGASSSSSSSNASNAAAEPMSSFSGAMYALECAANHGEHELISSGIHEGFANVPFADPRLCKTSELCDWLVWGSQLQRRIDQDQLWGLMAFMPAIAAKTHLLCSVDSRVRSFGGKGKSMVVGMPKEQQRNRQRRKQREQVLDGFVDASQLNHAATTNNNNNNNTANNQPLTSSTSSTSTTTMSSSSSGSSSQRTCVDRSKEVAVLDVIPFLLSILQQNIRPVNPDLYTPREKQSVAHVISVLTSYGLSFSPSSSSSAADGWSQAPTTTLFALTPEIDHLVSFESDDPNINGGQDSSHDIAFNKNKNNSSWGGGGGAAKSFSSNLMNKEVSAWQEAIGVAARGGVRLPGSAKLLSNGVRASVAKEVTLLKLRAHLGGGGGGGGGQQQLSDDNDHHRDSGGASGGASGGGGSKKVSMAAMRGGASSSGVADNTASSVADELLSSSSSSSTTGKKDEKSAVSSLSSSETGGGKEKSFVAKAKKRDFFGNLVEDKKPSSSVGGGDKRKLARKSLDAVLTQTTNSSSGGGKTLSGAAASAGDGEEDGSGLVLTSTGQPPVKYNFQKGFTNAIKRPVFMTDLV